MSSESILTRETINKITEDVAGSEIEKQVKMHSLRIKDIISKQFEEMLMDPKFLKKLKDEMIMQFDDSDTISDMVCEFLDSKEGYAIKKKALSLLFAPEKK